THFPSPRKAGCKAGRGNAALRAGTNDTLFHMLSGYPRNWKPGSHVPPGVWIDLLDPTSEEKSAIEETFGLRVPTREELSEIESTSRLRAEPDTLYMSAPLISVAENGLWSPAPTGFVLSKKLLI